MARQRSGSASGDEGQGICLCVDARDGKGVEYELPRHLLCEALLVGSGFPREGKVDVATWRVLKLSDLLLGNGGGDFEEVGSGDGLDDRRSLDGAKPAHSEIKNEEHQRLDDVQPRARSMPENQPGYPKSSRQMNDKEDPVTPPPHAPQARPPQGVQEHTGQHTCKDDGLKHPLPPDARGDEEPVVEGDVQR